MKTQIREHVGVNFVTPDATQDTRLVPVSKVEIMRPDEVDAAGMIPVQRVQVIERRDAVSSALAFLIKYLGLTLVLLVLSVGLTQVLDLGAWLGVFLFGAMCVAGYALLAFGENVFTSIGVERLRVRKGAGVLHAQIQAQRDVQLAQVALQRAQVDAQRAYNEQVAENARTRAQAQLVRHEQPQAQLNALHNYAPQARAPLPAPVGWQVDELEPPAWWTRTNTEQAQPVAREVDPFTQDAVFIRDGARRALLDFLLEAYERDEQGQWLRMHEDGRVKRHVRVPVSSRGGLAPAQRQQALDMLAQLERTGAWLLRYDEAQRLWRLNVERYPDVQDALDAVDTSVTVAQ